MNPQVSKNAIAITNLTNSLAYINNKVNQHTTQLDKKFIAFRGDIVRKANITDKAQDDKLTHINNLLSNMSASLANQGRQIPGQSASGLVKQKSAMKEGKATGDNVTLPSID